MDREKIVEMIGMKLLNEIKRIASEKNVDIHTLVDGFEQVIDVKIVSPDIAADEVAAKHDKEEDLDNLKEDVMKFVHEALMEEYHTPTFLN